MAKIADLIKALRDYERADRASMLAMSRRMALGPGSSSSRKGAWTTANARWANAAEHRDKCKDALDALLMSAVSGGIEP